MRYLGLMLCLVAALSACTTLPLSPEASRARWQQRLELLTGLDHWSLQGRLAMRQGKEGMHASLLWRRQQAQHIFDLRGPLGQGHIRLTQDSSGAHLQDAKQQSYFAATAQQLLLDTTGWNVPLDNMNYWILGLPAPGSYHHEMDGAGRLSVLQQGGWRVQYLDYAVSDGYELPSKLLIVPQVSAQQVQLAPETAMKLRLVITRWQVGPQ